MGKGSAGIILLHGVGLMYDYILMRWTMAYVTDLWVMDRVSKFLTDAQSAVILNTT
ncbi:hypothetical protein [Clostridium sp. CF012]|uniref:hypothetical protein n=1 Tax=Clostridium sp. CF012 TaxID=2843319 RepID=UPI001C0D7D6F|nr:hypothetical protein [Clostridium sp. CF012]MBU3145194.1 hypothetical protein [Clostridium sp. CF012]